MIDTALLGQQAARCMESLDEDEFLNEGKVVSAAVIVIAENSDGTISQTRTFMSDDYYYQQLGIVTAALECVKNGFRTGRPEELEEDDDDE